MILAQTARRRLPAVGELCYWHMLDSGKLHIHQVGIA